MSSEINAKIIDKNQVMEKKACYLAEIRELEERGEREFNEGLTFREAINILPNNKQLPYQIDAYVRGYWRGREKKLCADNPEYLQRRESFKFSKDTVVTVVFKVLDENESPALLGAMYHQDDPSNYIAGCEAISITKGDLRDQVEGIRHDIYDIVNKYGIIGMSGL